MGRYELADEIPGTKLYPTPPHTEFYATAANTAVVTYPSVRPTDATESRPTA